jgi:hypothetical protein
VGQLKGLSLNPRASTERGGPFQHVRCQIPPEEPVENRSTGRNLRPITLTLGTWAWVVVTLVVIAVLVWMMQVRLFD